MLTLMHVQYRREKRSGSQSEAPGARRLVAYRSRNTRFVSEQQVDAVRWELWRGDPRVSDNTHTAGATTRALFLGSTFSSSASLSFFGLFKLLALALSSFSFFASSFSFLAASFSFFAVSFSFFALDLSAFALRFSFS